MVYHQKRTRTQLLALSAFAQQQRQPVAWVKKHWVLVSPRARIVVPFHSVCLDHGRGVPASGESFYLAERPLPGSIQRMVISAALNGLVPQREVWERIEREHLSWYDPRNAFQVQHVHGVGAGGQTVPGRLHISSDYLEWREAGGADDFAASCAAVREVARGAVPQMGQALRIRIENTNYTFIPSGNEDGTQILQALRSACAYR
jgi:hypothetical protein